MIVRLALPVLLAVSCAAQSAPAPSLFPMTAGFSWTYRAHVKYAQAGTPVPGEADLRWTSTVVDAVENDKISAALLRGGPWDLASYRPSARSGEYLVVRLADAYYLVKDGAAETFADIKAGKIHDFENRLSDDIWFRIPMRESDTFCAPDMEKQAPMYCWAVDSVGKTPLKSGKVSLPAGNSYQLIFRTNPDHEIVTLVPGVGITAWEYAHHGTAGEAKLQLVEYRIPKPAGPGQSAASH